VDPLFIIDSGAALWAAPLFKKINGADVVSRNTIRDSQTIKRKAPGVKFILTDGDGVLNDGSFSFDADGNEVSKYSLRDVQAVKRLRELAGVEVGLVNDRDSYSLEQLALKMGIRELHLSVETKELTLMNIVDKLNIKLEDVLYIGDEMEDIKAMEKAGLSACPLDAVYETRNTADYVCNSCGGHGVLREISELIIASKTNQMLAASITAE